MPSTIRERLETNFVQIRPTINQCYFSLEMKNIKISWCHVIKLLFPSNADQALVLESFFWCNLRLEEQKITGTVEKMFKALSYRIVSCSTVIEDQTAQSTFFTC